MLKRLSSHALHARQDTQVVLAPLVPHRSLPSLISRSELASPPQRRHATSARGLSPRKAGSMSKPLPSLSSKGSGVRLSSTQTLLKNAITHVLLQGPLNEQHRENCVKLLEEKPECFVLLRGAQNHAFRGLYAMENAQFFRLLYGNGPPYIDCDGDLIKNWYKYDSGRRGFIDVPTRGAIGSVCAIVIDSHKH